MSIENDRDAITHACRVAQAHGEEIEHGTARAIAAGYDEPGIAHTFVTTGAVSDGDGSVVWRALTNDGELYHAGTPVDRLALDMLGTYLLNRDDHGPVPGWSGMWVR